MLLTISIPVYNGEDYIKDTLKNIFDEIKNLDNDIEILISDNCSNDNTQNKIISLLKENNLSSDLSKIVHLEGGGRQGSYLKYIKNRSNLGIDKNILNSIIYAEGKYVHLHSVDDYYVKGTLKLILDCIKKINNLDIICLSNIYLNTFNNKIIKSEDKCDNIMCEDIDSFIEHERLKMLCLSNIVINKEEVLNKVF